LPKKTGRPPERFEASEYLIKWFPAVKPRNEDWVFFELARDG
jgi:hypothetical protein